MNALEFADSVVVSVEPDELYDMVSDVTRTGEWSPVCRACWWDDGDGPHVGAQFTGRNETPERTWETRSQVVAADRGREFAWEVNGGWVRWGFTFEHVDGGTRLTESWVFLPRGLAGFRERYRKPPRRRSPDAPKRPTKAFLKDPPRSRRWPKPADPEAQKLLQLPATWLNSPVHGEIPVSLAPARSSPGARLVATRRVAAATTSPTGYWTADSRRPGFPR